MRKILPMTTLRDAPSSRLTRITAAGPSEIPGVQVFGSAGRGGWGGLRTARPTMREHLFRPNRGMNVRYLRSYINLPMLLGILCAIGGAAALASTLAQNAVFGASFGETEHGVLISSGNSLIMDSFAAVLAMVIGAAITWRRYLYAGLLVLPLALYLGYSMQSTFGFGMTERMAKAERIRIEASEARAAVERENASVLAAREELRGDLMRRVAEANTVAGDRRQSQVRRKEASAEKRRLDEVLTLLANAPPALKALPPAADVLLADPQADIVARWLGVDSEWVAAAQIGALAIGLPLAKVLGFMLASGLFHMAALRGRERMAELRAEAEARRASKAPVELAPVQDAEPRPLDIEADLERSMEAAVAQAQLVAVETDHPPMSLASLSSAENEPRASRDVESILDKQHREVNDIQAYLATATDEAPTVQIQARQFFNHYRSWAALSGREPQISNLIVFGNLLRVAGLGRDQRHNKVYYVGRSLRPLHDDVAAEEVGLDVAA